MNQSLKRKVRVIERQDEIMELIVKHFSELSTKELWELYKLRVSVFVVEQKCPYLEIDDADCAAYHLWLKDKDDILAYARVLPQGVTFSEASIGRVIAVKRRCGFGGKIVEVAISVAKTKLQANKIAIEAQVYWLISFNPGSANQSAKNS